MSEWFKELVLKTSDSERGRGFESHLLRFRAYNISYTLFCYVKISIIKKLEMHIAFRAFLYMNLENELRERNTYN